MTEPEHEVEQEEPSVSDVPEPDQEPDEEEAEAEAAETHEPSEEPAEAPEAHGPTQEEWEERFKKAEKSFKTYTAAVTRYWEEDAVHLMPFPLDAGAPAGFIDVRNKGRVDDETKQAALAFLGFDSESGMNADPHSHTCEVCAGWGLVTTGSKVPNNDVRSCLDCKGLGYVPEGAQDIGANGTVTFTNTEGEATYVPAATGVESPEVESLRLRGYTIIPPMQTST